MNNIIFLDIDGVLITTFPAWKKDEIAEDGHSRFNKKSVDNLLDLLNSNPQLRIVLSSSRRIGKDLNKLEEMFSFRGIKGKLIDKIPDPKETHESRDVEISKYIEENKIEHFLIIDDDKALLNIAEKYKKGLILTEYREGFNEDCLEKATLIVDGWSIENDFI